MKKFIYLFLLIVSVNVSYGQNLSFFGIDTTGFPILKAKFFAFDGNGQSILNFKNSDFELKENGINRKVTLISCPQAKPPSALSSVITVDVSGSMSSGIRILMAKEAAKSWVNGLPLGNSDCAITSFDNLSYLNQDFTTDKNKLLTAINSLTPQGGTDYDAGFMQALVGGLEIAKTGKNKKVLIFLSDGEPNNPPNVQNILNFAIANNVMIYAVTLNMICPQSLKDISTQTGGQWFENVTTEDEAKKVYLQILRIAQGGEPCMIEWKSEVDCDAGLRDVDVKLLTNGSTANSNYFLDFNYAANLEFSPYSLSLLNSAPGKVRDSIITVKAKNFDFEVSNITCSNPAFSISPTSFNLKAGQSMQLKISVIPPDSGYIFTKFEFENKLCTKKYYVNAGFFGKKPKIQTLRILHPNGGEVFVAGNDTIITWEGILPTDLVKIDYSIDNGLNWKLITDTASGLSYKWKIPSTPSKDCIARVTTNAKYIDDDNEMVLIPSGSFVMGSTGRNTVSVEYEKPTHKVTISKDFLMSKYEVSQKRFRDIMGSNPSPYLDDSLPVEKVTWYEAVEYCNKISEKAGLQPCYSGKGVSIVCDFTSNGYRLPTEAEWEYACKAGTTTDLFNGDILYEGCSPIDPALNKIGWYCGNTNNSAHKIGKKLPNPFGLYDMNGNVCEWVWDWTGKYLSNDQIDPKGPTSGKDRVVRGGSWQNYSVNCRSANRHYGYSPDTRHVFGFRVVRTY
jgi:VWFA-related protein